MGFAERFAEMFELPPSEDFRTHKKVVNMLLRLEIELASHPDRGAFVGNDSAMTIASKKTMSPRRW
jgi:hypothetical protein